MLKLGEKQTLQVEKPVPMGVYLKDPKAEDPEEHVLLPRNQVPEGCEVGQELEVFIYLDSEDRVIATRKEPRLCLHEIGYLPVKEVARIGAFLDWGLDKDLLLPYHEQPKSHVKPGQSVLCAVYLDKSGRLCATMNVYPYLRQDSPYHAGDEVNGTVYQTSSNFGTFVAVDDIYSALVPKRELVRDLVIGEKIRARVARVKPDGKLDLSLREQKGTQIEIDGKIILQMLKDNGGHLALTDRSDPEKIRSQMHMSKVEYKRAIGHLYRNGEITIGESEITLKDGN